MRVLVLAADYPNNNGGVTLMYIHARNRVYIKQGIEVDVLNFNSDDCYDYEGVNVITLAEYKKKNPQYDVLISHAPNLRNHYRFLKRYGDKFPRFIFFFHGHEVLKIRDTYSTPYPYIKNRGFSNSFIQDVYDACKLNVWRKYYPTVSCKSQFIFVSGWMYNKFKKYVKIEIPKDKTYIIPNNVGTVFEKNNYDQKSKKDYDFVTIRSNLDGSKYSIDIVNRIAKENPEYKFLVVGQGKFFEYYEKADNIEWINGSLPHKEIPKILNRARCALMPTRLDAQGVMMCEMATYGIPLMTSDIDICQEISTLLDNVIMISNSERVNLKEFDCKIEELATLPKNSYFFEENTVGKEISIIKGLELDA